MLTAPGNPDAALKCNLYNLTTTQSVMIAIVRAMVDLGGNWPPLSEVFPDYFAPVHPRSRRPLFPQGGFRSISSKYVLLSLPERTTAFRKLRSSIERLL